jgi:hypothetical protein
MPVQRQDAVTPWPSPPELACAEPAFKVVAEVLELGIFKHTDELIDFSTTAIIGNKHGFVVERLL